MLKTICRALAMTLCDRQTEHSRRPFLLTAWSASNILALLRCGLTKLSSR